VAQLRVTHPAVIERTTGFRSGAVEFSCPRLAAVSGAGDELLQARRLTRRGLVTRDRIVRAAADLMHTKGVNATTLDDVRIASGTSKSQLYRHFADKESLVQAVISLQAQEVLARHRQRLERLNSIRGLELWRDASSAPGRASSPTRTKRPAQLSTTTSERGKGC
jgi:hypothetical protein